MNKETKFDSHGGDSELNCRTGQKVQLVRGLTPAEADLFDVGPMFRVRFEDGHETDAFLDELPELAKEFVDCLYLGSLIYNITLVAAEILLGRPVPEGYDESADGANTYCYIYELAVEYAVTHPDDGEQEEDDLEDFARERLKAYFDKAVPADEG